MRIVLAATSAILIAGCAAPAPTLVDIKTPFNELVTQSYFRPGHNEIKGSAFLRRNDGVLVTCAGNTVNLIPATEYAKERMQMLYGGVDSGFQLPMRPGMQVPSNTPDAYRKLQHETQCDVRGEFEFTGISDGEWFAVTTVAWKVGAITQGGRIMKKVAAKGGQSVKVVMTR